MTKRLVGKGERSGVGQDQGTETQDAAIGDALARGKEHRPACRLGRRGERERAWGRDREERARRLEGWLGWKEV